MNSSLAALLVAAAPMVAQSVSAQLSGQVTGKGGEALAGASVVVRNTETGFVRTVQTDGSGRYIAIALPVGPYQVTVSKAGYQTASNLRLNLNLGDAAPLNVRLAQETGAVVEVVAASAAVDTERASTAAIVSPDSLTNLPSLNRSFTSLATLTPQVVIDSNRGNLAIAGQRGVNTSINIDGGDNNEPFFGGALGAAEGKTPFTISIEAIREYQVVTDGASAEFGRMGGGYVNAITKSGSNELAGSLFYYQRPKSLLALNPNLNGVPGSNAVSDYKQQQYGFSLGGPILKDKLLYFIAYDGQRKTTDVNFNWGGSIPVTPDPATYPNDAAMASRTGAYSNRENSDVVFLRLDWIVNTDHAVQLRVNRSNFTGDVSTGITNTYENTASDLVKTLAVVGQWNWMINTNWMSEFRINWSKDELPREDRSKNPQVQISDSGRTVGFYGAYPFIREYETKRTQITESISYVTPTLQVKAGIDINKIDIAEVFASFFRGGYSFSSLANFRAGNWSTYQQRFGLNGLTAQQSGDFVASEQQQAAFIQADYKAWDDVKIGVGLRMDRQTHPDFGIANYANPTAASIPLSSKVPTDTSFSPRLSLTWTPAADRGNTVVRFNVGRYVSTTPSVFLYQAYTANGVRSASVTFTPAQATQFGIPIGSAFNANAPFSLPTIIPTGATVPAADLFTFSPDFTNPRTDRVNLGIERGWQGWVFGLSGTYAKTTHNERVFDLNLAAPTLNSSGRLVFPTPVTGNNMRPNTNYRQMAMYVSDAEARYSALTLSARYQKDGSPFQASFFYTFSQNRDNDSNERNFSSYSTQNTQRLMDEWSWADTDRRNIITGTVSWLEKRWTGIQTGLAFRYQSGSPYSMTVSGDRNQDGVSGNDRLYLNGVDTGRNSQRVASNITLDVKLSRDFKFTDRLRFTVSAEVFNLLNRHDTYIRRAGGGSSDTAAFVSVSNAIIGIPRQVQLGARFSF